MTHYNPRCCFTHQQQNFLNLSCHIWSSFSHRDNFKPLWKSVCAHAELVVEEEKRYYRCFFKWRTFFSRYEIRDPHLVEENVLQVLKDRADFDSYKPRPFNMREFYDRTGHDIKDMLLSCFYRGSECSADNFDVVSQPPFRSLQCDYHDLSHRFSLPLGIKMVNYAI